MKILLHKIKEVVFAVAPVVLLVLMLHLTIAPLSNDLLLKFITGSALTILGLAIFLLGVDLSISPIGNIMGENLAKKNKMWIVIIGGFFLGFFISVAEPDLHIIAKQIDYFSNGFINNIMIIVVASIGIGLSFSYGLTRIVKNFSLKKTMLILYTIILLLAALSPNKLMGIAFDTSGATTGAMAVPFILALTLGIAKLNKNSTDSAKDSFGLVGIVSAGVIIIMLLVNISKGNFIPLENMGANESLSFFNIVKSITSEVVLALLPILLIFILFNKTSFKFEGRQLKIIQKGLLYTFIGMIFFLVGVNSGFLEVGREIGHTLANKNFTLILFLCFILGMTTILAEPAVYVLTKQIEEVTAGYIKRKFVIASLAIGVGLAIVLSIIKIKYQLDLWLFLLPGYGIAILLMLFTPNLFVGIAFDSGGVASGPMTATFILAFMHGVATATEGATVLSDGFGMIALVALVPIITLQILGIMFKLKSKKEGV